MVLPAGKGRAGVVIDTDTYHTVISNSRTDRTSSSTKTRQTVWPGSCPKKTLSNGATNKLDIL